MPPIPLQDIKSLTDNIKAGKQIVLFPPGTLTLLVIIGLLIVATATFIVPMITAFASNLAPAGKATCQFAGLFTFMTFVVMPVLLMLSGKPKLTILTTWYARSLLVASGGMVLLLLTGLVESGRPLATGFTISAGSALLALLLLHGQRFLLFREFYRLLKSRD